jgi:hypothetical protein
MKRCFLAGASQVRGRLRITPDPAPAFPDATVNPVFEPRLDELTGATKQILRNRRCTEEQMIAPAHKNS